MHAWHEIFLKPQYKMYRGASVPYSTHPLSDVHSFKNIATPRVEPTKL